MPLWSSASRRNVTSTRETLTPPKSLGAGGAIFSMVAVLLFTIPGSKHVFNPDYRAELHQFFEWCRELLNGIEFRCGHGCIIHGIHRAGIKCFGLFSGRTPELSPKKIDDKRVSYLF
jgi:hypothetical protein